ncbi:hypothetical protein KCP69_00745 [Salmonella enterica subsp. enterica]|nr:hypothetical protein KCP69_00745 [Salmonella enterica subsp. enterica]
MLFITANYQFLPRLPVSRSAGDENTSVLAQSVYQRYSACHRAHEVIAVREGSGGGAIRIGVVVGSD